jgi:hypothetical protein
MATKFKIAVLLSAISILILLEVSVAVLVALEILSIPGRVSAIAQGLCGDPRGLRACAENLLMALVHLRIDPVDLSVWLTALGSLIALFSALNLKITRSPPLLFYILLLVSFIAVTAMPLLLLIPGAAITVFLDVELNQYIKKLSTTDTNRTASSSNSIASTMLWFMGGFGYFAVVASGINFTLSKEINISDFTCMFVGISMILTSRLTTIPEGEAL